MLGGSGAALPGIVLSALPAVNDSAKSADNADERATVSAGIALGCTFLVAAGTTNHRISFAKRLSHHRAVRGMAFINRNAETANLHHGPHFTTRLAACSHVDNRSGPACSHPSGTGASRRFSPSHSKHSQPSLNSDATTTCLRKGLRRRSGVWRRSANPPGVLESALFTRRSTLRRSAAAGVTSQTSHRFPLESVKVR